MRMHVGYWWESLKGKTQPRRSMSRRVDNSIKQELKEKGSNGMDWTELYETRILSTWQWTVWFR
jgi:hypothetical protein